MNRFGIDLGGTKIEGMILDQNGKEIFRQRLETESHKGYEHILKNILTLYQMMIQKTKSSPHTLGIGTPGRQEILTEDREHDSSESHTSDFWQDCAKIRRFRTFHEKKPCPH